VKWAAAAAVLLFAGFGFGRAMSPTSANAAAIRAAIEPSLKNFVEAGLRQQFAQELRDKWQIDLASTRVRLVAEYQRQLADELAKATDAMLTAANADTERLLADFARTENERRAEEKQTLIVLLKALETMRLSDRKDLETLAMLTEASLRSARQEIAELASDRTPAENK
jgi:hypothetical protein